MTVSIRLADLEDIPAALELCRLSGWNQKPEDWRRLIQYEPSGCFVAASQGRVVGTVTTTRYGQALAWIGMMLVHPEFRRQGIATDLMNRSLDYLRGKQVRCIKLDATPEGRHVYQRLGFAEEWSMQRWQGEGMSPDHHERSTMPPKRKSVAGSSLNSYRELDQLAFGVDRWDWILRLVPDSDLECHPSAMGMRRCGFLADYLGPVIAADSESARA
ncbi:MAG: GNAT family N-acetyltransferase, partial [Planctomycetes bacterium]|nr:GNAT family N-acetyltransferase [Planctomycetota bacterium]